MGTVTYFVVKLGILAAGTEHNTPRMEPMVPACRDGVELDGMAREAFWSGACVIVAHQYLTGVGKNGYVDITGKRTNMNVTDLEAIGKVVIAYYLEKFQAA